MSTPQEDEAYQQQSASDPGRHDLVALLAALPWLLTRYCADSIKLLETEGRIALRSLVMIAALALCLAGVIAGGWLILVVLAVYLALDAGISPWAIAAAAVLLHIVVFAALVQQVKTLSRYLLFPNSRRAVIGLISPEPISPDSPP